MRNRQEERILYTEERGETEEVFIKIGRKEEDEKI